MRCLWRDGYKEIDREFLEWSEFSSLNARVVLQWRKHQEDGEVHLDNHVNELLDKDLGKVAEGEFFKMMLLPIDMSKHVLHNNVTIFKILMQLLKLIWAMWYAKKTL